MIKRVRSLFSFDTLTTVYKSPVFTVCHLDYYITAKQPQKSNRDYKIAQLVPASSN